MYGQTGLIEQKQLWNLKKYQHQWGYIGLRGWQRSKVVHVPEVGGNNVLFNGTIFTSKKNISTCARIMSFVQWYPLHKEPRVLNSVSSLQWQVCCHVHYNDGFSNGGKLGSSGWINSLIPVGLAREKASAVNVYMSKHWSESIIYFYFSWLEKRSLLFSDL